jgi:caffeoyl-CoA O-methyltransferase
MFQRIVDPSISQYLDNLVPERPAEMQAMEAYARRTGFPIVGPASGYFCYQVARMIGARRIFEMGSGYGYSTAWFAKAVQENGGGAVYHVVWNADLSQRARQHLTALGFNGMIQYRVSEAVAELSRTDGPFDIIFNDIDKDAYAKALPVIREKLRPGGVLIVDNTLWYGRVVDRSDHSADTSAIREMTDMLADDPAWITTIVPVRDGLLVAYRK